MKSGTASARANTGMDSMGAGEVMRYPPVNFSPVRRSTQSLPAGR